MKKLIVLFIFLVCATLSNAQIQSNCTTNAALLESAYEADINMLAINRLYEIKHADTSKIIVPQIHKDSIISAMVGVFNLGTQLDADSVFKIHCLHDYQSQVITVRVIVDTNYAWTSAWQNMQTTTANLPLNQLLSRYGFTLSSFNTYTIGNHLAILQSNLPFNPQAFCDSFNAVITGAYALPDYIAGTSNRLDYAVNANTQTISFSLNWETCPTGCINSKAWIYTVDNNCTVTMATNTVVRAFAPPPPPPINCGGLAPQASTSFSMPELKIYPNPTTIFINISNIEKGEITVRDLAGRIIQQFPVDDFTTVLDISNYVDGVYLLEFRNEKGISSEKILKH